MRTLAQGPYTHAQVAAQLAAPSVAIGSRFEILDNNENVLADLTTVHSAQVEMNIDRAIKGALTLKLIPTPALVNQFFRRRIRAWFRMRMPDGGIVEYPMGVYIWNIPARELPMRGIEEWNVTLADKGWLLDAGGPGPSGFVVADREPITTGILRVLDRVGITDRSRIATNDGYVARPLVYSTIAADQYQPMTWRAIVDALCDALGYYSISFDGAGRPVVQPQADLRYAKADWSYETNTATQANPSMTESGHVDPEIEAFANRIIVVAKNAGGFTGYAIADADTIYPTHPLRHAAINLYVDDEVSDQVSGTQQQLETRAQFELINRLAYFQRATLNTLPNPAHEAFDVIAARWDGDSDLGTLTRFHERRWTFDLTDGGLMVHELRRMLDVT